jgi:hypothetical protein
MKGNNPFSYEVSEIRKVLIRANSCINWNTQSNINYSEEKQNLKFCINHETAFLYIEDKQNLK